MTKKYLKLMIALLPTKALVRRQDSRCGNLFGGVLGYSGIVLIAVSALGMAPPAEAQSAYTGCLSRSIGLLYHIAEGDEPSRRCRRFQQQITIPGQDAIDDLQEQISDLQGGLVIAVLCPQESLQVAIDVAGPDTTILVQGTCTENIVVPSSKQGLIVNGAGSTRLIAADGGSPVVTILGQGITLMDFSGDDLGIKDGERGVVVANGASATIHNNLIVGAMRAGITVEGNSFATITGNAVRLNNGNGIAIMEGSSAQIGSDCTEETSNAIIANGLSGVAVGSNSEADIIGNRIQGNRTNGIFVTDSSMADTASNSIAGNQADGIALRRGSSVRLGRRDRPDDACLDDPNESPFNNVNFGINCQSLSTVDGEQGSLIGNAGAANLRNENSDCPDCCFTSLD